MPSHDVFLSYSSQDKPIADAACATLESRGIRCWMAPRDVRPAQDWSEAIIDAIGDCTVFLLVLSVHSNQSEQVKREVQNAVGEAKPLLPLRIDDVALSKHMRYFIGTPHWLDALTPPLERHLLRMADTVQGLMRSVQEKCGVPDIAAHVPPEVSPETPILPSDPPAQALDAAMVTAAGQALARYLGPVGHVLAKREAKKAVDAAALHRRLAEHLTNPAEKSAFLHAVGGAT
jgi:hypothetical protein